MFNYSTGALVAESGPHAVGHLIGLAQVASVTVATEKSSIQILLYSQANGTQLFAPTFANADGPYTVVANWQNEIFVPQAQGFSFLYAATGQVVSDFQDQFPKGIVLGSCIMTEGSLYFASGSTVYAYDF